MRCYTAEGIVRDLIRVLLLAPGHEIVGGQTVQAVVLMQLLGAVPGLDMQFQASNPLFPRPLRWVKRIPMVRTALSMALFLPIMLWRSWQVDILHIFTAGLSHYTLWTIPAILIAKLYGKKIIINYRDGQCDDHIRRYRTAKPTLLMADAIVAPSGFLVDVMGRHGIPAETIVNVAEAGRFIDRKRSRIQPRLLSNRGLEPLYNVECILRAFGQVQARYPEATLTVAHDGPSRASLEALASSLNLRNCNFTGKVRHADIPALYDSVDIYVNTPNIDNMPGTLLECMASGLPIVSTDAGGIPYIVRDGETALLVPVNDDKAVAAQVRRLLEDPVLVEKLTGAGRREVLRYSGPPVRDQWVALYKRLATARPADKT
jgi:glycosyltransferase involved in cell wall biosynthesis